MISGIDLLLDWERKAPRLRTWSICSAGTDGIIRIVIADGTYRVTEYCYVNIISSVVERMLSDLGAAACV